MASSKNSASAIVFFVAAAVLALLCAFFVFYTVRLLYVTQWLAGVRAGGRALISGQSYSRSSRSCSASAVGVARVRPAAPDAGHLMAVESFCGYNHAGGRRMNVVPFTQIMKEIKICDA
jgi:hypothetical protein